MNEFLAEIYNTAENIGMQKQASAEEMEKLAEQDFLGRQMAHAFVDELSQIEKQAGISGAIAGGLSGAISTGLLGAGLGAGVGAIGGGTGHRMEGAGKGAFIGGGIGGGLGLLGGMASGHVLQKRVQQGLQALKDLDLTDAIEAGRIEGENNGNLLNLVSG